MRGKRIPPDDLRCREIMRYLKEPCWRLKGHGGPHRSRWDMEQRRLAWVSA